MVLPGHKPCSTWRMSSPGSLSPLAALPSIGCLKSVVSTLSVSLCCYQAALAAPTSRNNQGLTSSVLHHYTLAEVVDAGCVQDFHSEFQGLHAKHSSGRCGHWQKWTILLPLFCIRGRLETGEANKQQGQALALPSYCAFLLRVAPGQQLFLKLVPENSSLGGRGQT